MDILITEDLASPELDQLAQKFSCVREPALWKDPTRLRQLASEARVLIIRNQTQVTAALLEQAPRLIGIGRVGVGLDNIDLGAASLRGVVVVAPLEANALSVAELTLGFLLALARKIPQADLSTKAGGWDRRGCTGMEVHGKTLLICGFGRVGRLVAARARAFGMRLLAFDPFLKPDAPSLAENGVLHHADLFGALGEADFISVHSPLTPDTKHLFNARAFACCKHGAFFINTSRGGVVDEAALIRALREGQLAGAALDVRETEPPVVRSGLEDMPQVILGPHVGAFTVEAQQRTYAAVAADMARLLQGQAALNAVNTPTALS